MKKRPGKRIRQFVLENVSDHPKDMVKLATQKFGVSRQSVSRHISLLIERGLLEAEGDARNRHYKLKVLQRRSASLEVGPHLEEDRVWRTEFSPFLVDMPKNVFDICHYGFTEMFNNVRDHCEGTRVYIIAEITCVDCRMIIFDNGVGIFEKLRRDLGLEDHRHAILELAKGKVTTDPKKHTGEGIFFTSRVFDEFVICSGHLFYSHSQLDDDWLIETKEKNKQGTVVEMKIALASQRTLREVLDRFAAPEAFDFSKTHVPVNLLRYGRENLVSRSQAKRLLARFESFREVLLDFNGVPMIGQAFADEIFRVFKNAHPETNIVYMRADEAVARAIKRVLAGQED